MTTYETILTELRGEGARRTALITLNRPKQLNALSTQLLDELAAALHAFDADEGVGCIVLTGSAKAFAAGADIAMMSSRTFEQAYREDLFTRSTDAICRVRKPIIAAVSGFALGGGCELALACTLRTAADTARLGLPEVSLGIIPGYGGTQRLARIAGPGVAREWVLTGEMVGAAEAHRVGVINKIFPASELAAGTRALLDKILSKSPVAVGLAMETIRRGLNMSQQEGEVIETDMFGLASTTQDMREGMAAFLEKRKPQFPGR